MLGNAWLKDEEDMRCVTKSLGLLSREERDGRSAKGRERRTREQLREDEHEYAGLVRSVRVRTKDERGDDRASGRRSDEGRKRREKEGRREIGGGGPFALF